MIKIKENKERVLGYFNSALKGITHVNFYYAPHGVALRQLISEGIINEKYVGKVLVGYEYKGYLFNFDIGSGDCEELLVNLGKI